jgi:hypothetical protein
VETTGSKKCYKGRKKKIPSEETEEERARWRWLAVRRLTKKKKRIVIK